MHGGQNLEPLVVKEVENDYCIVEKLFRETFKGKLFFISNCKGNLEKI